jgi:hypothetical protein
MTQRDAEDILEIFDKMDLEEPNERRIALFALNDFFGTVFGGVGKQLDFRTSDFRMSIGHQWQKASSRLEEIDSVEIPEDFYGAVETVSGLRGDYAHDFRDSPPAEPIKSARKTAPDWAEWIRDAADEYEAFQESLTATEALVQVGERTLDDTLENWIEYREFSDQAKALHKQAKELEAELQSFKDDDEVTKTLVNAISDILEWEADKSQFKEEYERWEAEEAKRQERIDRAENTYNFLVLEEVDDFDKIVLGMHEPTEPDTVYHFTVSNHPLSEEEMQYLRGLNVDEEVSLWIGSKMYRNRYGNIDHDEFIKEVVDAVDESENTAAASDW